jgi:type II secretory pathway component PulF
VATFVYEALGAAGARRGVITAPSAEEAARQLAQAGLMPVWIRQRGGGAWGALRQRRVKAPQVADAVRNLADLLSTGGVPLLQALVALQKEESSPAMAEVLGELRAAVEGGRPLAEGMAARPDAFPDVVVRIVGAAEARGDLDRALQEAARYLERQVSTAGKIRGALAYPAFVLITAVGVVVFMSAGVLPKLATMFEATKVPLPLSTRLLMAFGTALARLWYLALPAAAGMLAGLRAVLRRPQVRRRIEILAWRLPGVRLFVRHFAYARWATTVGLMHAAGVPLLVSLELARGVAGNAVLREALGPVTEQVRGGERLSAALRATGAFPESVLQIVALGEEHGTLGEMLQRIGRRYEVATERLLEKLPAFIEPAFVVVIGVIVAVILLALYYPLLHIYQIAATGG